LLTLDQRILLGTALLESAKRSANRLHAVDGSRASTGRCSGWSRRRCPRITRTRDSQALNASTSGRALRARHLCRSASPRVPTAPPRSTGLPPHLGVPLIVGL